MIIEYEGQSHQFDFDDITVKQAMKIEKHTGLKMAQWGELMAKGGDLTAIQAFGWLILSGGAGEIEDADFKLLPLASAFQKALAAEEAPAEASVPTAAVPASNGQTPAPAGAATQLSSATA